jgi:hypothetical protein
LAPTITQDAKMARYGEPRQKNPLMVDRNLTDQTYQTALRRSPCLPEKNPYRQGAPLDIRD